MKIRFITTPIYYVNGDPHIGHAHTSIMGDILKRYNLMKGADTLYSTGTDEHGQKNQEAIEKSGLTSEEYLTRQSNRFKTLFDRLNVSYDYYVRTSHQHHGKTVSLVLDRLYQKQLVYKKEYSGLYCLGCEQFKKISDLDSEGRCPDHLTKPVQQTETNYFLKLEPYRHWLIQWITSSAGLIQPEFYKKEILGMLEEPLEDLCISRPKSRVWLGIELPFDPSFVTYVWFDALINYISTIGYNENPEFDRYWNHSVHLMAKDIIKTHIIYWPIMLKALDLNPPSYYRIHGYWIAEGGQKMSKSLGNYVEPNELIDAVGTDGLRYYLAKTMGGSDAQISKSLVVSCYNTDLANNIGNLLSRVVKFAIKRFNSIIPSPDSIDERDASLREIIVNRIVSETEKIDLTILPESVKAMLDISNQLNLFYNDTAPWQLAKDPLQQPRLESTIYVMLDCIRMLFEFMFPVIPSTSNIVLRSLGLEEIPLKAEQHHFQIDRLPRNGKLSDPGSLFPRIDITG